MFGFGKKKPAPAPCASNPGRATEFKLSLSSGGGRTETVNLVRLAATTLKTLGHRVTDHGTWLEHPASGYSILPQIADVVPLDNGGVRTVTTIQVNHAALVPGGLFEYQHASGDTAAASIAQGFENWARVDLVSLLEAAKTRPENCTMMEMEFPPKDGRPARVRRVVLGPVAHFMQHPPPADGSPAEEHPFCPCCMFTRTAEAFKEIIEDSGFYGIRFFAARDENGEPQADCRVNGDDWERGAEALRAYVATWPAAGYEFRKQYVVLRSADRLAPAPS